MNRGTEMDKDPESRETSILEACSLVILTLTTDWVCRSVSDPKKDNRYLGVDLSSNLDWKEHIDWTVKKANSVLDFLRRNVRLNNCEIKSSAYVTLVRPHLEYCASIWSPHTDQYKQKLEMVQRRSARYCTNRYFVPQHK